MGSGIFSSFLGISFPSFREIFSLIGYYSFRFILAFIIISIIFFILYFVPKNRNEV